MSLILDHLIFGNGRGLGSPYFDNVFYWIDGHIYTWVGGFGAQLQSFQWTRPPAGTRRRLLGVDFVIFRTERIWFRVQCSWARAREIRDVSEIIKMKAELDKL